MTNTPFKLRTRIGFYFLGLVATWTLFVLLLLGNLLSGKARELDRDRGAQIARGIAVEAAPLVHYEDTRALAVALESRMAVTPDIRYIIVSRDNGEVVWSTFPEGVPAPLLDVPHPTEAGPDVRVQLVDTNAEQLVDYEARQPGAHIRLGMSLTSVQGFAEEVTSYVLWIGMAALLAVLAITLRVSRPVEALAAAVSRVTHPASTVGVSQVGGTFETAAVAEGFESMAHQLEESGRRLEESARRLDKSKKLAYLGEVAASIAHEINNPLGIIVLNTGFLAKRAADGELEPACAKEVERVSAAATRATLAAQKLLQFARYSTQTGGIKRRPCRPEPLIRETVELLRDRIHVADCPVVIDVPESLQTVKIDQQGVQQVLFNLITNALDASESGGTVTINAHIRGESLVLSVTDEGRGMDEKLLEIAKEPFITTKAAGGGTGLGLAISDSIVRGHGGTLELFSEAGKGTTVTVTLPPQGTSIAPKEAA